jgi:peptidyl-prolyl cis-trans isomerase B (cyclophilin B)
MKKSIFLAAAFSLLIISGFSQNRSFTGKPIYQILTKRGGNYLGTTTVELFPAIAPLAVNNFDSLVSVQFYDSTAFHRVIPGFMIQGGDPNSRSGPRSTWGMGDPNQPNVPAEFSAARHVRGTLSAARDTGINSANSQFFICVAPASWLNGQYTVYGRVTSGMNIVDTIVSEPRDSVDNPLVKIEMFITFIGSNDTLAVAPNLTQPLDNSFSPSSVRVLKWDALSDGIIYHVDVSTDSTFATTYRSIDIGTNLYTVTGLVAGSRYYWRVNTNNGGNVSGYSPVWNFLISGTGIDSYALENQISVTPNPSSGQFLFSNLERENTIEVFDVTGRSVLKTSTKNNSCQIDLSDKSNGLYFYSITSQNKIIKQGKIILE